MESTNNYVIMVTMYQLASSIVHCVLCHMQSYIL